MPVAMCEWCGIGAGRVQRAGPPRPLRALRLFDSLSLSYSVSRLLQEEDTDYAAEKLQAADELRQWSEAAQCSSIACLVGAHFLHLTLPCTLRP